MTTMSDEKPKSVLREAQGSQSFGDYVSAYFRRVAAGDLGSLPIIVGVVLIAIFFQVQNDNYLTPRNFVNLIVQMAGVTTIAYGVVFVLLIGEIDLSASYVSAVAGVGLVVMMTNGINLGPISIPPLNWYTALTAALVLALGIGFLHGTLITQLDVPAFIVTLAGFMVWSGVVQIILGTGGMLRVTDPVINGIANAYLSHQWSWIVVGAIVAFYAGFELWSYNFRQQKKLATKPLSILWIQIGAAAIAGAFIVQVANTANLTNPDRGLPLVGILMFVMLAILSYVTTQTPFGRYLYAVGGNAEAARRAGVNVKQIRLWAFMLSSFMAAIGGIILVSRLRSVSTNAGGGDLLLNSIAAAVIGGTSLFGGRGHVSSAILGALVIASLDNGMGLLGWSAGNKLIVTGIVLVIAVLLDSFSRRRQKASGLG